MALPNSGPISIRGISAEFGGGPNPRLSDYYKGGTYVTPYANASNVPTSGRLSLSNFYGAAALDKSWLTPPGVEYSAVPGLIDVPDGWYNGRAYGVITPDTVIFPAPPPSGIDDSVNVHTLAVDVRMTADFVYDTANTLHFVVASRHSGSEYLGAGDNRSGAVIGGSVFENGYYGIEGVELGDYYSPVANTFPWVWPSFLMPEVWWRVVIVTQYAPWGSSMKAMLYDQTGSKRADTDFYSISPNTEVFNQASKDHCIMIAIVSDGPETASFAFKNVRSYWSADASGIPANP